MFRRFLFDNFKWGAATMTCREAVVTMVWGAVTRGPR
jgi:hypothetical protein